MSSATYKNVTGLIQIKTENDFISDSKVVKGIFHFGVNRPFNVIVLNG